MLNNRGGNWRATCNHGMALWRGGHTHCDPCWRPWRCPTALSSGRSSWRHRTLQGHSTSTTWLYINIISCATLPVLNRQRVRSAVPWQFGEEATRTVLHVGDVGGVPRCYFLVEALGVSKHCRGNIRSTAWPWLSCAAFLVLNNGGNWRARCSHGMALWRGRDTHCKPCR